MATAVLDAHALLAFFRGENAGIPVKELLHKAAIADRPLHMTEVNYAEVKYMLLKKDGPEAWDQAEDVLKSLPLEFLPKDAGIIHFVNADLIASRLSPLRPELANLSGGHLFLAELDRHARVRVDFAFETTLNGRVYLNRLKRWQAAGYRIEIRQD